MKRVGIIGGMGPLASADLYMKIIEETAAGSDQENIPLVIDSYPQIEDRTAFILGKGENPLPRLSESAVRLKNAGCKAFAMACTVKAICKNYPNAHKIAVLATIGTKKAKIYDDPLKEAGLISVELGEENQAVLMDCIYKGVKAGKTAEYVGAFENLLGKIDADAINQKR